MAVFWPERKASAGWHDPFPWVFLVIACGGAVLFIPAETGSMSSEWWALEEVKPLPG